MRTTDLAYLPALEQAALVRRGDVTPEELHRTYLDRIEALNPSLNAYLTVCVDPGPVRDGPLRGVPISIKDLTPTAGIRTTFGSRAFADHVPDADTAVVRRIRDAGCTVLGKTNTPEFGTTPWTEPEAYGPARNPWDRDRTPGGSSGGAAAALAAGMCAISHGTDGGGSIRIPASCCGLVGLKPSRGRVSNAPNPNGILSTSGPIARTVADAAALLDVLTGYEPGDAWWTPAPPRSFLDETRMDAGGLRVALSSRAPTDGIDVAPANRDVVGMAGRALQALGHHVEEADPDYPQEIAQSFVVIWAVQQSSFEPQPPDDMLDPVNRAMAEMARSFTSNDVWRAIAALHRAARRLVAFFDRYDVLVTPTVAQPPPHIGECKDPDNPVVEFFRAGAFAAFTPPWNASGQPAISLPLHRDEHGLPVGAQLVGPPGGEAVILRVAAQLERALPWTSRTPAL